MGEYRQFTFFKKFSEILSELPEQERDVLLLAIGRYGAFGEDPGDLGAYYLNAIWISIKEDIDNSVRAQSDVNLDGTPRNKGGRPRKRRDPEPPAEEAGLGAAEAAAGSPDAEASVHKSPARDPKTEVSGKVETTGSHDAESHGAPEDGQLEVSMTGETAGSRPDGNLSFAGNAGPEVSQNEETAGYAACENQNFHDIAEPEVSAEAKTSGFQKPKNLRFSKNQKPQVSRKTETQYKIRKDKDYPSLINPSLQPTRPERADAGVEDEEMGGGREPPGFDEVERFCSDEGFSFDVRAFYDRYSAAGWRDGRGRPIRSWRRLCATCQRNHERDEQREREALRAAGEVRDYAEYDRG